MSCDRHPQAATLGGHCPACLLEQALAASDGTTANQAPATGGSTLTGTRRLTIQVPLGHTRATSVFLVREDGPMGRLLRLKVWRTLAPAGFLVAFLELRQRLAAWSGGRLDPPLAACVDLDGCPSVLSEFRQGIPILDGLRSGALDPEYVAAALGPLVEMVRSAHDQGLAHGSIGPGNVLVQRGASPAYLLDFGIATLLAPLSGSAVTAADRLGLAALLRIARGFRRGSSPPLL